MILIRFGKGQRLSNVAAHSLTQGVVPPFHMRSLPSFLPNTMMGFSRKHVLVGMPKITEGVAVLVVIWNALPQTAAGGFASLANGEPHDLARSAAHRRPQPSLVIFFAHKTPDFIQFENVMGCRRQKGFFAIRQVLDVRFEPARNGLPRHGKDACNSTQATTLQASRSTVCCSVSAYACFGLRTRYVPQSLQWS